VFICWSSLVVATPFLGWQKIKVLNGLPTKSRHVKALKWVLTPKKLVNKKRIGFLTIFFFVCVTSTSSKALQHLNWIGNKPTCTLYTTHFCSSRNHRLNYFRFKMAVPYRTYFMSKSGLIALERSYDITKDIVKMVTNALLLSGLHLSKGLASLSSLISLKKEMDSIQKRALESN